MLWTAPGENNNIPVVRINLKPCYSCDCIPTNDKEFLSLEAVNEAIADSAAKGSKYTAFIMLGYVDEHTPQAEKCLLLPNVFATLLVLTNSSLENNGTIKVEVVSRNDMNLSRETELQTGTNVALSPGSTHSLPISVGWRVGGAWGRG